jgi:hypothetical protein
LYLLRRTAYEEARLRLDGSRASVPALVEQITDRLEA